MIKIICVGKIKENYLDDGIKEYLKRLTLFDEVKMIEVKEVNHKEIERNLNDEAEIILSKIDKNDFVITLEIKGKILSSEALATLINDQRTYRTGKITFVIGGSNGLAPSVIKRSDFAWSFSLLTFPHQMMRMMLLEQIYRAFTIINNQEYHK